MNKVWTVALSGTLVAAGLLYGAGRLARVLDEALCDLGDAAWT